MAARHVPLVMLFLTSFVLTSWAASCTWQDAANPVSSVDCSHQGSVLTVTYQGHSVTCDQDLSSLDLQTAPRLHWSAAKASQTYLLLMLDPDAPTPCQPNLRYIVHWAAFVMGQNLHVTHEFVAYRSPHPPAGTPAHRYQLFLYEWGSGQSLNDLDLLGQLSSNHLRFDLENFKAVSHLHNEVVAFQIQYSR
ncbi:protein D2-like isoform X1 [Littorina saxatilis]|uniref:Phosphatidylethanolamine-binding protein n=1 Tax=Littorina saxatilis TaxID=31220 RepID=A0AAN9AQW1_9CAEN